MNNTSKIFGSEAKVCIDEFFAFFRRGIMLKQYFLNKRHRYGIKSFKICTAGGYIYKLEIYASKDTTRVETIVETVVVQLMDALLDQRCCLLTGDLYTTASLAKQLISR